MQLERRNQSGMTLTEKNQQGTRLEPDRYNLETKEPESICSRASDSNVSFPLLVSLNNHACSPGKK